MTNNEKPQDDVCVTCWIRGQGEPNKCVCGRGEFVHLGLLEYIELRGKQQGKLELVELLEKHELFLRGKMHTEKGSGYNSSYYRAVAFHTVNDWLKSQLKEGD